MTAHIRKLWNKAKTILDQSISWQEKASLVEKEIISSKIPELSFRTMDLEHGFPLIFERTIFSIIKWSIDHNNQSPTILRPGNGSGRDLLIQKVVLKGVGIEPNYYLVDYDELNNESSFKIDPARNRSYYICHNLFEPLINVPILSKMSQKIDIVDCQEILHEILSPGTGGSDQAMINFLLQIYHLLRTDGLLVIDDVNIVENNSQQIVEFKLSEEYTMLFEKFVRLLRESNSVERAGINTYRCSLKLFSIFCCKVRFVNLSSDADARELMEIHKTMTKKNWVDMLNKMGFGYVSPMIIKPPQNIAEELRKNIVIAGKRRLPPFSIHLSAIKQKSIDRLLSN